jgi:hypothetical protein
MVLLSPEQAIPHPINPSDPSGVLPVFLVPCPDCGQLGHHYFPEELESVRNILFIPRRGLQPVLLPPYDTILRFRILLLQLFLEGGTP